MNWSPLTHQLHSEWKTLPLRGKKLLLLVSGGADSVALFRQASLLKDVLGFELWIGHMHHGSHLNFEFRDWARDFAKRLAEAEGCAFLTAESTEVLVSEEDMRNFRRSQALHWQKEHRIDWLLSAHQADDLLETRFFRLLRGTGVQGLEAMKVFDPPWWKPFLSISREQILSDLEFFKQDHLQDPSNENRDYRRNWIRHELFPQLERQMPGSVKNLREGLQKLTEQVQSVGFSVRHEGSGLSRPWFLTLSIPERKQALAQYLWGLQVRNYRQTQIEEILKQLDISQIEHRFRLAGCDWQVNAGQIRALPLGSS